MAVKKATTTDDLTAAAEDVSPTLEQQVAQVEELTDPAMVADVKSPKYVKVKSGQLVLAEQTAGAVPTERKALGAWLRKRD